MRKLLVVIDMQNDFVRGSLANPAAEVIIPNIVEKIKSSNYDYVVFTRDTHQENYMQTMEGKNLPVSHCIENSYGWNIVDELNPFVENVINKPTFGYIQWKSALKQMFPDERFPTEIEFVGTCTDICVVSNALICKALFPETTISVDSAACAGLSKEKHEAALETMRSCQVLVR